MRNDMEWVARPHQGEPPPRDPAHGRSPSPQAARHARCRPVADDSTPARCGLRHPRRGRLSAAAAAVIPVRRVRRLHLRDLAADALETDRAARACARGARGETCQGGDRGRRRRAQCADRSRRRAARRRARGIPWSCRRRDVARTARAVPRRLLHAVRGRLRLRDRRSVCVTQGRRHVPRQRRTERAGAA